MYESKQKLKLLHELNQMSACFNKDKGERKYVHLITYKSGESEIAGEDEWAGRLKYIKDVIYKAEKNISDQNK